MQYDIYHMQIMEGHLAKTIEAHLPRIAHMQLADVPGRHEPGTGEIDYGFLLDFIDRTGYNGWIGCEYIPKAGTVEGLGWTKALLVEIQLNQLVAASSRTPHHGGRCRLLGLVLDS